MTSNCCSITKQCYHLTITVFPEYPSVACVNFYLLCVCMAEIPLYFIKPVVNFLNNNDRSCWSEIMESLWPFFSMSRAETKMLTLTDKPWDKSSLCLWSMHWFDFLKIILYFCSLAISCVKSVWILDLCLIDLFQFLA